MRFLGEGCGGRCGGRVVKRSAHRCDELHAALMASCTCEAAVWSAVVPQRVRAIGHCLQQRSMRYTSDSSLVPARSLAQLKLVLAASKTLASAAARGRTAVGVSEDLSLAATNFVSFVVVV